MYVFLVHSWSVCVNTSKLFNSVSLEGGAWLDARKVEDRRRFRAVLSTTKEPRTFSQIREERRKAEKAGTEIVAPTVVSSSDGEEDKALDGFFLVRTCKHFSPQRRIWSLSLNLEYILQMNNFQNISAV